MIKIGITGSNGFIGWHLCQTLKLYIDKFEIIKFNRNWFENTNELDDEITPSYIISTDGSWS
jgi:UDP-2-acetamido-2,6-beta-L-arabino-hexul-4-ose reductase